MSASWDDLFDRGREYDADLERIRTELEAVREADGTEEEGEGDDDA